jgi:hypothetical protein
VSAIEWLRENRYDQLAARIEEKEAAWKAAGKATRRDWWQVLAGDKQGKERTAGGEQWPIIAAAREREGLPPVKGALRKRKETPVPPKSVGRWKPASND